MLQPFPFCFCFCLRKRRWRSVTFSFSFISFSQWSVLLMCFPRFNSLILAIPIPIMSVMILIKRLFLDSCLESLMIQTRIYPLLGHQMFPSATGQVSHAVGADREWFPWMFPAWDYKVQSLLFSAISYFLQFSTLVISHENLWYPTNVSFLPEGSNLGTWM